MAFPGVKQALVDGDYNVAQEQIVVLAQALNKAAAYMGGGPAC